MVTKMPRRTSFSGPALVRLLSRLGQVEVTEPRQSPAARLDEWLGWTESIVLSTVLNAAAPDSAGRAGTKAGRGSDATPDQGRPLDAHTVKDSGEFKGSGAGSARASQGSGKITEVHAGAADNPNDVIDDVEFAVAECAKVRDALEQAISVTLSPPAPASAQQRRQYLGAPKALVDVDFPSYRRRYSMLQQKMETSIAALRGRLRALLSARGPEMAQLAAVDGAMEQAMVEHELRLLASIPNLLEQRFRQLAQEGLMKEPAGTLRAPLPASLPAAGTSGGTSRTLDEKSEPQGSLAPKTAAPGSESELQQGKQGESRRVSSLQAQLRQAAKKPDLEPGPWLDTFREDMRSVLLAELDLRLQPIEGLLCALRAQ
ncbi:uncharacterized protein DUF3348 [Pusillimonas noertemannii]|uniref:Uncharacterized protein DUF3348 n=2 Tax=Pusillimonas noertemannii TaxID=305977 RepID=A0A2U1CPF3_9BURK|nr:DUF3348 family protein [Pusillimonas noertemannii]NYT67102.1 DUF3348 domain-containing protein [Pusillimonas noertemannii]PVY67777.1 uncharacterized protein DUF3348 [Pusillimonas noertemannii]TFL12692.1 DUF3348 family protein [Pusillimonas noertemannii]